MELVHFVVFIFRFGLPFVLYLERTVTWDALQKEILEKMRHLLRPGVYIQVGWQPLTLPYTQFISLSSPAAFIYPNRWSQRVLFGAGL